MKIVEKSKVYKRKIKKTPPKPKKERVAVVAQEIKFARLLAGNEQKTRDRALKSLKKWLLSRFQQGYEFKENDFIRVWKGLFYAVWMSDKPLVQEELCESISGILDVFPPEQLRAALMMTSVGLRVLATEWYGIDSHRLDKFLMLVRRYLRGSLRVLHRHAWSKEACRAYAGALRAPEGLLACSTPHYARNATSMVLHFVDCFLEELAKVSGGAVPSASVAALLRPFIRYMCEGAAEAVRASCRRLLTALLRQSDQGLEYQQRTRAWEQMGCPAGGPEALELVVSDEEEGDGDGDSDSEDEGPPALDPRAGRVDVWLPSLPVPSRRIAAILRRALATLGSKAHQRARICLQRFEQLSAKRYPLVVACPPPAAPSRRPPRRAARQLQQLERSLVAQADELALRGLSRKHRKRLLAKSRAGLSIVDDLPAPAPADTNHQTEEPPTKKKKKPNNKENRKKNEQKTQSTRKQNSLKLAKRPDKPIQETNNRREKEKVTKTMKNTTVLETQNARAKIPAAIKETKKHSKTKLKETISQQNTQKPSLASRITNKPEKAAKQPTVVAKKVKNVRKPLPPKPEESSDSLTPKKVKFVLKNNSAQGPVDYYKSVRQRPSIPFDSTLVPSKTNLKPSTPSPINPFFKKKMKMRK